MSNLFAPVQRQKMKLRMALTGVSGGGKTLGALYLAYGLTDDWGKVALIDTERERGRAYASRSDLPIPTGEYLYAGLYAPYSPERYKEYVRQAAEAVGPDGVVIVDSLSHAWNNEGGVLEIKDRRVKRRLAEKIEVTPRGMRQGVSKTASSTTFWAWTATPSSPCEARWNTPWS